MDIFNLNSEMFNKQREYFRELNRKKQAEKPQEKPQKIDDNGDKSPHSNDILREDDIKIDIVNNIDDDGQNLDSKERFDVKEEETFHGVKEEEKDKSISNNNNHNNNEKEFENNDENNSNKKMKTDSNESKSNNIDNIPNNITPEKYKIIKQCKGGFEKIKESKYFSKYYISSDPNIPCLSVIEKN